MTHTAAMVVYGTRIVNSAAEIAAAQTATDGDLVCGFTARSPCDHGKPPSRAKA
jgi:hypothetical protein